MTNQMTIEQAREIANRKRPVPLTDSEWKELFAAEAVLKVHGELKYATYDED